MCLGYQKSGTASSSPKGKLSKHEKQQCHLHNPVKETNTFLNLSSSTTTSSSGSTGPRFSNPSSCKLTLNNFSIGKEFTSFLCWKIESKYMHSGQTRPPLSLTPCKHELVLHDAGLHLGSRASLWVSPALSWVQPFLGACPAISRDSCLLQIMSWGAKRDVLVPLYAITLYLEKWAWQTPHQLLWIYALWDQCEWGQQGPAFYVRYP